MYSSVQSCTVLPFSCSFQDSTTLQSLDLGYSRLGGENGLHLAHTLANNYGLVKLVLRWNHLRFPSVHFLLKSLQVPQ